MKKLELKDIAGYLPYRLLMFKDSCTSLSLTPLNYTTLVEIEERKPILRPMSDLYKPCLEDGKIPIVELARIAFRGSGYDVELFKDECRGFSESSTIPFRYNKTYGFTKYYNGNTHPSPRQLELFHNLYEWHFDIHGLIELDLAIDINTIRI